MAGKSPCRCTRHVQPSASVFCHSSPVRPHCPPSRPPACLPPLSSRRRYGLLGVNGCGKSTLLQALGARDVPIPNHIDIFLLDREMAASDQTALEAVMSVDEERHRLETEAERLLTVDTPEAEARLEDIYER